MKSYKKNIIATLALIGSMFFSNGCCNSGHKEINSSLLEKKIQYRDSKVNDNNTKYALIVNGVDEKRYTDDICRIYENLREIGFRKENIYILDEDGRSPYFTYPVDGVSSKENIEEVINYLKPKIDLDDMFLIHISDHGVKNKKVIDGVEHEYTEIVLPGGNLSGNELSSYLSGINPGLGLLTTDICYGGDIAKIIGRGNFIGISSSNSDEEAFQRTDDSFCGNFYDAYLKSFADIDKSGVVTIDEAIKYAKNTHSFTKKRISTPQIESERRYDNISLVSIE